MWTRTWAIDARAFGRARADEGFTGSGGWQRMNILFFLTPKSEVAYINCDDTLSEALEKMESHHYAAVPLLNHQGK